MASKKRILVINPNSTQQMTDGLKDLVDRLGYTDTQFEFFTAPSGPPSINSENDVLESATCCMKAETFAKLIVKCDAFLVACYSRHPLVDLLRENTHVLEHSKPVTGIFEASIATSLQITGFDERFGIVSTGKVWEELLDAAVRAFLGRPMGTPTNASSRWAGVQTTGLNAIELHDAPAEEVRQKMKDATKRLLRGYNYVGAICLGCAGMAGMDEIVREACVEELGEAAGKRVAIVDGVMAGVAWLDGALRMKMRAT